MDGCFMKKLFLPIIVSLLPLVSYGEITLVDTEEYYAERGIPSEGTESRDSASIYGGTAADTSDPLWIPHAMDFLTRAAIDYSDDVLRLHAGLAYGFSNRFSIGASLHYQNNFDNSMDGFSKIDFAATYRLSDAGEGSRVISDLLLGVKLAGDKDLRRPEFADTVYHAGLRMGRVWSGLTLAGTLRTSWVFDSTHGLAFIDFIPEIYFRISQNWRIGLDADLRKATDSIYDAQWLGGKLVRQFGFTQYIVFTNYEFKNNEWRGGLRVNVLF